MSKFIITNEDFTSQDVEECDDLTKLLKWYMQQRPRVAVAEMKLLSNSNAVTTKHVIAQKALLDILEAKIKILEYERKSNGFLEQSI